MAHERIKRRAERIYEDRLLTGKPGSKEDDWLQAEAELCRELDSLAQQHHTDGQKREPIAV